MAQTICTHNETVREDVVPTDHEWARKRDNWVNGRVLLMVWPLTIFVHWGGHFPHADIPEGGVQF